MPNPPKSRPYRPILVALIVSGLLICIPAALSLRAGAQLADSFHWVLHTLEVERQAQRILTLLVDAETGGRGFLLSTREVYLEPYQLALNQLPGEFKALRSSTSDNRVQQANLDQLDPVVTARRRILDQMISLQQGGDHEAAMAILNTNRGKQLMDDIRAKLSVIELEEARLLVLRQQVLASRWRSSSGFLFALIALNWVFAGAMLFMFHRVQKNQGLVKICSWSRTVEYQNEWLSFEEYLSRRFDIHATHGISPEEFEKALENLKDPKNTSSP